MLDDIQTLNAMMIIRESLDNSLGSDGAVVGIMTALTNSNLYNVVNLNSFYQKLSVFDWKSEKPWIAAQKAQSNTTDYEPNYEQAVEIVNKLLNKGETALTEPAIQPPTDGSHILSEEAWEKVLAVKAALDAVDEIKKEESI